MYESPADVALGHVRQQRDTLAAAQDTLWRAATQLTTLLVDARRQGATLDQLTEASGLPIAEVIGLIEGLEPRHPRGANEVRVAAGE
jgi:hypothetical protein